MFLQSCQRHIESEPDKTIGEIYFEFCKLHGLDMYAPWSYDLLNQGFVTAALYAILVFPYEMWGKDAAGSNFKFSSRDHFRFSDEVPHSESIWSRERYSGLTHLDFLRLLRNAVSHANIKAPADTQPWIFWNIDLKNRKNFEVRTSNQGLGFFITEVGKFFVNEVRVEKQTLDSKVPSVGLN